MTALRLLARPAMAAIFVTSGIDALRHPKDRADQAEGVALPIARKLGLPEDPVRLVQINAAVHVVAGSMLAFGRLPRLASAALTASMVPTTLAAHRFWEEEDPAVRAQQKLHFMKNLAMTGGLLLAVADTGGRPSMAWWARRGARRAAAAASGAAGAMAGAVNAAESSAVGAVGSVGGLLAHAGGTVAHAGGTVARAGATSGPSTAASLSDSAVHAARSARGLAGTVAETATDLASRGARGAGDRAVDVAGTVRELAGDAAGPTRHAADAALRSAEGALRSAEAAVRSAEKVLARVPDHLRSH